MRLINARAYRDELQKEIEWPGRSPEFIDAIEVAIADLSDMPTIDAVEVVRCRDCDFICEGNVYPVCTCWGRNTEYDGWCYMGERREDDG